jgi:hypothetical protein
MAVSKVQELKKHLTAAGFLVYRTGAEEVHLAELARENLIMDASVSIVLSEPLRVRFCTRAQRSDFPWSNESTAALFERARRQAATAMARGFREVSTAVAPQTDPVDAEAVLDVWYQAIFEREVASLDELDALLAFALALEKVAPR